MARVFLNLSETFAQKGFKVDLVVCQAIGEFFDQIPPNIRLIQLKAHSIRQGRSLALSANPKSFFKLLFPILMARQPPQVLPYLPDLIDYLKKETPRSFLSGKTHTNLVALWASKIANTPTRMVISERTNLSFQLMGAKGRKWRWRFILPVIRTTYPSAQAIIAVSNGVADDLSRCSHIPRTKITTVYNPVVTDQILQQAQEPLSHPWFSPESPPVILGTGRLVPQKDFPTLIKAFAKMRKRKRTRLIILGDSDNTTYKNQLIALANSLGVGEDIQFPGFVKNPFSFMANASLFVLSSKWEGLPGVLIQALACGCPVVSTNCESGPAEILNNGEFGKLVPISDVNQLAEAMLSTLEKPLPAHILQTRSMIFSANTAFQHYQKVLKVYST